jgi:AcrR family transcriptional regulator
MGRRPGIQPEQIVQSALILLSTRGVEAITIAQIAQQAGISEASIYKFFTSKEELLRACMTENLDPQEFWQNLGQRIGKGSVSELLEEAALFTVRYYKHNLHTLLLRVLKPNACCSGPQKTSELQALYFQREMAVGRIRADNPNYLAATFCGPLFYHVYTAQVLHRVIDESFAQKWAKDFSQSLL